MNKYARVESFNAVLSDLNPRGQFKIEDADTIAMKGIAPQYLKYHQGINTMLKPRQLQVVEAMISKSLYSINNYKAALAVPHESGGYFF